MFVIKKKNQLIKWKQLSAFKDLNIGNMACSSIQATNTARNENKVTLNVAFFCGTNQVDLRNLEMYWDFYAQPLS